MKGQLRWALLALTLLVGCARPPDPSPDAPEPASARLVVRADCGGVARCHRSIGGAMAVAQPGDTVLVSEGTFRETVSFQKPDVTLRGSGAPEYRAGALVGGTLIVGSINCAGQPGARVADIGVSASPPEADAITSGRPAHGEALDQCFENLALLGGGFNARSHALLCQSGSHVTVRNVRMYHWYHGLALKCTDATVVGVYGYQCAGNTIIVKSDKGSGDAARIEIRDVTIDGNPQGQQWGGGVRVQSAAEDAVTHDVKISGVSARNAARGAILLDRLQGLGSLTAITVTHVVSEHACVSSDGADYDVSGASDVLLQDCQSVSSRGYGFRARDGATGVWVLEGAVTDAAAGSYVGEFDALEICAERPGP